MAKHEQTELSRENKRIYRYFCNGGSWDRPGTLACLISGDLVEGTRRYSLHHIRYENRVSVHKTDRKPFDILRSVDLTLLKNSKYLLDLMGTVPVGWEEHAQLHREHSSRDIDDIPTHKLPWALRDKANFNEFRSRVGIEVRYEEFVDRQRNSPQLQTLFRPGPNFRAWARVTLCLAIAGAAALLWTGAMPATFLRRALATALDQTLVRTNSTAGAPNTQAGKSRPPRAKASRSPNQK